MNILTNLLLVATALIALDTNKRVRSIAINNNLNFTKMADELVDIEQEVSETKTVQQSAKLLLESLHAKLIAAGTDKAKLAALAAELSDSTDGLAAAVAANTVAAEEAPAEEEETSGE